MKKIIVFSLICLSAVLASCSDDSLSGCNNKTNIKVLVVDKDGKLIPGAKINLYYNSNHHKPVLSGETNSSGEYRTKILEGVYAVSAWVPDGLVFFRDSANCMALGGQDLSLTLRPFDNVGSISVQCVNPNGTPAQNVNVSLIAQFHTCGADIQEVIPYKYVTLRTDTLGNVTFTFLPLHVYFSTLVWDDNNKWFFYCLSYPPSRKDPLLIKITCMWKG